MTIIYAAIALFGLSAVFGLTILIRWLRSKGASKGVIYSHGLFAAAALVLLVVYALNHPGNYPGISLALFLVSAVIGFYMFFRDLKHKMSPMALAFTHAILAVCGFVGLLLFALS